MAKNKWVNEIEEKVENKAKEAVAAVENKVKEEMVDFNAWFAARRSRIDAHHYKEIIMADMKARGLDMMNTMAKFDEALAKYGIKLK